MDASNIEVRVFSVSTGPDGEQAGVVGDADAFIALVRDEAARSIAAPHSGVIAVRPGESELNLSLMPDAWALTWSTDPFPPKFEQYWSVGDATADGAVEVLVGEVTDVPLSYFLPSERAASAVVAWWNEGTRSDSVAWTDR